MVIVLSVDGGRPQKGDAGYDAYTAELNERFDCDNMDGALRLNQVTVVYSEVLSG